MKILIGCEESQTVTKEFRKLGFEAYSNDIIECSGGHPEWHLQMDIINALQIHNWDLVLIHLPCTKIALCGNSTYGAGMKKHTERIESIEWTKKVWDYACSVCELVAFENPKNVMGKYIGKRTQAIQPFEYGHLERKETWLWLKGLPKLKPTNNVYDEIMKLPKAKRERIHYCSPGKDRGKIRSKTFEGIAKAIAEQWTEFMFNYYGRCNCLNAHAEKYADRCYNCNKIYT